MPTHPALRELVEQLAGTPYRPELVAATEPAYVNLWPARRGRYPLDTVWMTDNGRAYVWGDRYQHVAPAGDVPAVVKSITATVPVPPTLTRKDTPHA